MNRITFQVGTFEVNCSILFENDKALVVDPGHPVLSSQARHTASTWAFGQNTAVWPVSCFCPGSCRDLGDDRSGWGEDLPPAAQSGLSNVTEF